MSYDAEDAPTRANFLYFYTLFFGKLEPEDRISIVKHVLAPMTRGQDRGELRQLLLRFG